MFFDDDGVLPDPTFYRSNIKLALYDTCANAYLHNGVDHSLTYVKEWAGIYWVIYSGPRVGLDLTWISRMSTGRGRCVARKQRIKVLLPAVVSRLTATSKAVALGYVLPTYASCPQRISGKNGKTSITRQYPLLPGRHGSNLLVRLCLWLARRSCARYVLRPRAYFPTHPHTDEDVQLQYERDVAR